MSGAIILLPLYALMTRTETKILYFSFHCIKEEVKRKRDLNFVITLTGYESVVSFTFRPHCPQLRTLQTLFVMAMIGPQRWSGCGGGSGSLFIPY